MKACGLLTLRQNKWLDLRMPWKQTEMWPFFNWPLA